MCGICRSVVGAALLVVALPAFAEDPRLKDELDALARKGMSARQKRNLRWELSFGSLDAKGYLERVDALEMFLVVPNKAGDPMMVRKLKERPAVLERVKPKEWIAIGLRSTGRSHAPPSRPSLNSTSFRSPCCSFTRMNSRSHC